MERCLPGAWTPRTQSGPSTRANARRRRQDTAPPPILALRGSSRARCACNQLRGQRPGSSSGGSVGMVSGGRVIGGSVTVGMVSGGIVGGGSVSGATVTGGRLSGGTRTPGGRVVGGTVGMTPRPPSDPVPSPVVLVGGVVDFPAGSPPWPPEVDPLVGEEPLGDEGWLPPPWVSAGDDESGV